MADAIVAVSQGTCADVLGLFKVDSERVHVIPNGIDTDEYHPTSETDELGHVTAHHYDDAGRLAYWVWGADATVRIAKATLAIERGAAMLGQQVGFRRDFEDLAEAARRSGASGNPLIRDRLARAWIGLRIL